MPQQPAASAPHQTTAPHCCCTPTPATTPPRPNAATPPHPTPDCPCMLKKINDNRVTLPRVTFTILALELHGRLSMFPWIRIGGRCRLYEFVLTCVFLAGLVNSPLVGIHDSQTIRTCMQPQLAQVPPHHTAAASTTAKCRNPTASNSPLSLHVEEDQ